MGRIANGLAGTLSVVAGMLGMASIASGATVFRSSALTTTKLAGDSSVESTVDSEHPGQAEAFPMVASTSGTVTSASFYLDATNAARNVRVGLYSDGGGHPGTLLTSSSVSYPRAGTWSTVSTSSTSIAAGTTYWLALLSTRYHLALRVGSSGTCSSQLSAQTSLSSLPSTWRAGQTSARCPVSAYVSGGATVASTPPAPSSPPPQVSGSSVEGQTVSSSTGSWSGSPSSYGYQWQDCASSGSGCASIAGATSSSYVLGSGDVGHAVRSVVTASNAAGSASAVSSVTQAVSVPPPTAAFTFSPSGPVAGQSVHFDASASTCASAPCSYSWADDPPSGGSSALGSGQTLDFTFQTSGTKYVTLTVTDSSGQTAGVEHDVSVATAPANSVAPANTTPPQVSGSTVQGSSLSTSNGSWSGSPTSYSYQWQDCDSSGASCTNISGATSSSYLLGSGDVGHTIRAVVTATNTAGSGSTSSAQTAVVTAAASGPVPCALTAAAESCWAAHTGVTGSTGYTEAQIEAGQGGFTHVTGDVTVTTPNTVISHEWISGCVAIKTTGVTIKDSLITTRDMCHGGNGQALGGAINDGGTGSGELQANLLVQDTTIDGQNVSVDTTGVGTVYFKCLRCNVFGFTHDITPSDHGTIQDSYIHDLTTGASGAHEEDVYADSATNVTVEHSYTRASGGNGYVTGAFMNGGTWAPPSNITLDNSYLEGDTGVDVQEGCGSTNVHVTNNAFSNNNGYGGTDFVYGFDSNDAGNQWTANYIPEQSNAALANPGTGGC